MSGGDFLMGALVLTIGGVFAANRDRRHDPQHRVLRFMAGGWLSVLATAAGYWIGGRSVVLWAMGAAFLVAALLGDRLVPVTRRRPPPR